MNFLNSSHFVKFVILFASTLKYLKVSTEATQAHFSIEKRHLVAEMSVDVLKNMTAFF